MANDYPRSTAKIFGHPIHPMLVPFPIAFLVGALLTDIAYCQWGGMWAYASSWLIGVGIVMALVAAIFGFTDYFGEPRIRRLRVANYHLIGNLTAVILSIANFLVHNRDGAAAVIPTGMTLSAIVVVLLLFNGWMGWEMVYRHGVGIDPKPETRREE